MTQITINKTNSSNHFSIKIADLNLDAMKILASFGTLIKSVEESIIIPSNILSDIEVLFKNKNIILDTSLYKQKIGIPLKDFQLEDLDIYIKLKKILDLSDMGTGKTAKAIIASIRTGNITLIICPKSLSLNWLIEIGKFAPNNTATIVSSAKDFDEQYDFYIIPITKVNSLKDSIRKHMFRTIVLDEAHYIKAVDNTGNPSSQRARAVMEIACDSDYLFLLSGTIAPSHIKDLYNALVLVKALDITFYNNFKQFAFHYCDGKLKQIGNNKFYDFNGASNLQELNQRLKPYMIRRLKKDIVSELKKVRQAIPIKVKKDYTIKTSSVYMNTLGQLSQLRQTLSLEKASRAIDFIDDLLITNKKIVIFTNYLSSVQLIKNKYSDNCVSITGKDDTYQRQLAIESFSHDSDISIIVLTLGVGNLGLNLQVSSVVVFIDLDYVVGSHMQAEDRICRIGQQNSTCMIYYLYAFNAQIDYLAAKILFQKFESCNEAIDGGLLEYDITKELIDLYQKQKENKEHDTNIV